MNFKARAGRGLAAESPLGSCRGKIYLRRRLRAEMAFPAIPRPEAPTLEGNVPSRNESAVNITQTRATANCRGNLFVRLRTRGLEACRYARLLARIDKGNLRGP